MREVGDRGWHRSAPQRESSSWVSCLEAFLSLLQVGIQGEVPGEGFREYSSVFQGALSRVVVFTDWPAQTESLVIAAGPGVAHLVLLLFWAWS